MTALRIGIVGGGIAGLAASVFLSRQHQVTLFEKQDHALSSGSGLLLQPVALHVLREAHVEKAVITRGSRIDRLVRRDGSGRHAFELRYAELAPSLHGVGIQRGLLCQALFDALQTSMSRIELATVVTALQQHESSVDVIDRRGRKFSGFDALVVCDGMHSRLREQVPLAGQVKPSSWNVASAVLPCPHEIDASSLVQYFADPDRFLGWLPLGVTAGTREVSFFWNVRPDSRPPTGSRAFAAWRSGMQSLCPHARGALAHLTSFDQLTLSTYAEIRVDRCHAHRVVMIGDAAHAMNPQLGMGANLALVDALILAQCLNDTAGDDVPQALARYARVREPQLTYYQRASGMIAPLMQSGAFGAAWSRKVALALSGWSPVREMALRAVCGYAGLNKKDFGH